MLIQEAGAWSVHKDTRFAGSGKCRKLCSCNDRVYAQAMTRRFPPALVCAALFAWAAISSCDLFEPDFGEVTPLDELSNPCFEADLLDGLSEEDPQELKAIFDCLNAHQGFNAAVGVVDALVTEENRSGRIAGLEMATVVNTLVSEVDLGSTLQTASDLIREQDEFLLHVVRTVAEWTYGRPWPQVRDIFAVGGGDLLAPDAVEGGLVQPLVGVLQTAAGAMLDSGEVEPLASSLGELAEMSELSEMLDTLSRLVDDQESELFAHVADDFGAYLQAAPGADGEDTLISLLEAVLEPQPAFAGRSPIVQALEPIDSILGDTVATHRLVDTLGDLYLDGDLQVLPGQIHSLLTIDVNGSGLQPGEETAFEAMFLLLEEADQPVDCALSLISYDSLAVFILEMIAGWDASTLETLVPLTEGLANSMLPLTSFLCSEPINPAVLDHLPSITRLAESGALHALVPLLEALHDGGSSHNKIRQVLDLLLALQTGGAIPALGDHALQELEQPFIGNVLEIVGAFVAPTDPDSQGDIYTIMRVVDFAVSPPAGQGYERSPLGLMAEPMRQTVSVERDRLADWLQRWAILLLDPTSESNSFLYYFAPMLALDPDLDFAASIGSVLGDGSVLNSALLIIDTAPVADAMGSSTAPGGSEGPLGLIGRISADGTLEQLLTLLGWAVDLMDEIGLTPTGTE